MSDEAYAAATDAMGRVYFGDRWKTRSRSIKARVDEKAAHAAVDAFLDFPSARREDFEQVVTDILVALDDWTELRDGPDVDDAREAVMRELLSYSRLFGRFG